MSLIFPTEKAEDNRPAKPSALGSAAGPVCRRLHSLYTSRAGVGLLNVLVALGICGVILVSVFGAFSSYMRGSQNLRIRAKADELLFSRAESLAGMRLTSVPADGVYGENDLSLPLKALLKAEEPVSFRLRVEVVPQEYPNYFWKEAPPRCFHDFIRFRLSAVWFGGSSGIVLYRALDPPVRAAEGGPGR